MKPLEGHARYTHVQVSPADEAYRCECGWQSEGYHDMTSYAYHEWMAHVERERANEDGS